MAIDLGGAVGLVTGGATASPPRTGGQQGRSHRVRRPRRDFLNAGVSTTSVWPGGPAEVLCPMRVQKGHLRARFRRPEVYTATPSGAVAPA